MPHKTFKKAHPEYNPHSIQTKIGLIEKGLPIDIAEDELIALEDMLRGARGFYIDILAILHKKGDVGFEVTIAEESKNLVDIEMALRQIDDFRKNHRSQIIKHVEIKKTKKSA